MIERKCRDGTARVALVGACRFFTGLLQDHLSRIPAVTIIPPQPDIAAAIAARPAAIVLHVSDRSALHSAARLAAASGCSIPLIAVVCCDDLRHRALRPEGVSSVLLGPDCDPADVIRALATSLPPGEARRQALAAAESAGSLVAQPRPAPTALTQRQRDVLRLAARGWTSDRIASSLRLSRRTIHTHRANLLRRLGVGSMPEAVAEAMRRGIIG